MAVPFNYTKAIVCGVPKSLPANAQRLEEPSEPINLEIARKEHALYVEALKKLNLEVIELEADEAHPDCVFVEDTAVIVGQTALLTNPGHESRRGEVENIKHALLTKVAMIHIVCMEPPATLDGGDVLFTGREFFVGLSSRTNQEGIDALAKVFPDFPVYSINVSENLHLKSMMSMGGEDLIVVGGSEEATRAWTELESKAKFKYSKLVVPEDRAANCLYVNGTLVHLTERDVPKSCKILQELPGKKIELGNSELCKVDGCLTCSSLLLQ